MSGIGQDNGKSDLLTLYNLAALAVIFLSCELMLDLSKKSQSSQNAIEGENQSALSISH